tara:strand:- start:2008 stop:2925 length:918 start_codon:yes stop_codon:yes gene_type:complete
MQPDQAGTLFNHLYPDDVGTDYLEIRTLPDKKQRFTTGVRQAVNALRGVDETNTYFGLCPRTEKSGKMVSTSTLPAVFVDFDFKDFSLGRAEVEHKLERMELYPTAVVSSGHGFHCYWRIRNQPVFQSMADRELAQGTLQGWCKHVGGDAAASRITSCPRVPGSGNFKYEDVMPVEIASLDDDTWYEYEDFTNHFVTDQRYKSTSLRPMGDLPPPPAAFFDKLNRYSWLNDLWEGRKMYGDSSRSGLDISLATKLSKYFHYSHEEIAAILMAYPHGKAPFMAPAYLERTVNLGVSYADSGRRSTR